MVFLYFVFSSSFSLERARLVRGAGYNPTCYSGRIGIVDSATANLDCRLDVEIDTILASSQSALKELLDSSLSFSLLLATLITRDI